MRRTQLCLTAVLSISFVLSSLTLAQSSTSRGGGPLDSDVVEPKAKGVLGLQDAPALTEVLNHLKVVGANPWIGMQGTGQITYGDTDSTSFPATLSILGNSGFRLDSQAAQGPISIRIFNKVGKIQEANGSIHFLPPDTAASGIFQFQLPRLAKFPVPSASLTDRGLVSVNGAQLHRLTFEAPSGATGTHGAHTVVTDLYFDPTTHLMAKSANSIHLNGIGNSFLRVISYSDYRPVGGVMIPFLYTQTLDGQKQWTLQLTEVKLNPALSATFFQF
jgi:hypothetical protein